jgi:acetyl-CoA decarbonylase/synthase complex subunit gamma
MNFTGSSTYTSLSGVKKEMRVAVPLQMVGFIAGFVLWIANKFV